MSFQLFPDFMACAIRAQSSGACAGSDIFCARAYDINLALRMGALGNRSLIFNQSRLVLLLDGAGKSSEDVEVIYNCKTEAITG